MAKPLVIQTEDLDPRPAAWLAERADLAVCRVDEPRFPELLGRAEGLVVRTYTRVDRALLAGAPRLRVVGRAGVGLDNVDVAACAARGVRVVYTPDSNTRAVVELVLAFMLDALRPRTRLERAVDAAAWNGLRRELTAPRQLSDLTLGVLGLGRIGSQVARAARALEMRVIYHDLRDIPPDVRHGAEPVGPDRLPREADVLTVHVDERPANRHLLGQESFALLKPGAVFINTSRGFVVDAAALAAHLRADPAARAFIDVHEPEPFGPDYPLLALPNAALTPHTASGTATAKRNMSWVVRDVWRVLAGEEPSFPAPLAR